MAGADNTIQVLSGLAAVLGHNFPVWLKFKGGKGVATSAGVIGALMPVQLGIALGAFLIVVLATRYISAGSMIAGVVLVGAQMLYPDDPFAAEEIPNSVMAALICVLVIVRHRSNISRLLAGTESKIGAKKKEEAKSDE
jgi:glycerol-3-phosphate acyltransferase PlsY